MAVASFPFMSANTASFRDPYKTPLADPRNPGPPFNLLMFSLSSSITLDSSQYPSEPHHRGASVP